MRDTWQLQRAKAELSKLIATSIEKGPQMVTRHGRPAAVVRVISQSTTRTGTGPSVER